MKMKSIGWRRLCIYGSAPFFALALALIAFSACNNSQQGSGGNGPAAGPPVNGDWVIVHDLSDPETLNLITATDATSQEIHSLYMYDALINTDPKTLEDIPWIADSLPTISPDRKSYDVYLKHNVKFSDGQPVTGEDFIFYLKLVKNPHIPKAAPLRGYFTRVDRLELVDGDKFHLRAYMSEPYYLGLQYVGGLYAFPKHIWDPNNLSDKFTFDELNKGDPHKNPAIQAVADSLNDPAKGFDKKYLVASGRYMFEEFKRGDRVVLARNPNYWNNTDQWGKTYPDKIIYRTINDQNAAVAAMKSNELDMYPVMEKVNFNAEKDHLGDYGYAPAIYDYPAYTYIGYNLDNPMFQDKRTRLALSLCVDRDAIIDKIYFGLARKVQSTIYYKRPECDTTLPVIPYDLAKAKALLAEAGWADSDGDGILDKMINGKKTDFRFSILLNNGNKRREATAVVFVDALKKVGIAASTSGLDWSTFLQRTRDGQYEAMVAGWAIEVREGDLYQIWHSKSAEQGGSNHIHYRNPEVDKLIEAIRGEFDFEKRKEYYKQIQKIIYDDQATTFLVSEKFTGAYSMRYQNVNFFAPRPCYDAGLWWVETNAQKYKAAKEMAAN